MPQDLANARNPDLRASVVAIQRAAELARKTAVQTGTALVIVKHGKLLRIPAEQLRKRGNAVWRNGDQVHLTGHSPD